MDETRKAGTLTFSTPRWSKKTALVSLSIGVVVSLVTYVFVIFEAMEADETINNELKNYDHYIKDLDAEV